LLEACKKAMARSVGVEVQRREKREWALPKIRRMVRAEEEAMERARRHERFQGVFESALRKIIRMKIRGE